MAGKRLVGLVHDHQTTLLTHSFNDALQHLVIPQVGSRVVGVRQVGQRRLVFCNSRQHGGLVQLKVGGQGHAVKSQPLQLGAHGIHDKTGNGRQHAGTGQIAGQGQQADEFVRAIAQHDVKALGHVGVVGQRLAQGVDATVRVTVQSQSPQTAAQFFLQRRRQTVRVFHGVELDHAGGVLHGIGVHGLHIGTNSLVGAVSHGRG